MRLTGVALAQHSLGRLRESQSALQSLIEEYGGPAAYQVAQVYAWTGDADHAFEWLERSHATRDPGTRYVKYDPFVRRLRGDLRYSAFLRKMNLPVD